MLDRYLVPTPDFKQTVCLRNATLLKGYFVCSVNEKDLQENLTLKHVIIENCNKESYKN